MKKFLFLALLSTTMSFAQSDKTIDKAINKADKVVTTTKNGVGTVYGDLKEGTTTVYSDVKDGIKALSPEAKALLQKTADKLEKTTDQLWEILVRQQRVWSLCYLLLTISSIVLWYRASSQFNIMRTDLDEAGDVKTYNTVLTVLFLFLAVISSIFSSVHFIDMMTGFVNPEFGAMKNIYQVYKAIQ